MFLNIFKCQKFLNPLQNVQFFIMLILIKHKNNDNPIFKMTNIISASNYNPIIKIAKPINSIIISSMLASPRTLAMVASTDSPEHVKIMSLLKLK